MTDHSAGTGTPLLLTHPKIRGAFPVRASDKSILELVSKQESVADKTAVSKTALTTCAAAPKPTQRKTTVTGEADAPLSSLRIYSIHMIGPKAIDAYY